MITLFIIFLHGSDKIVTLKLCLYKPGYDPVDDKDDQFLPRITSSVLI